MTGYVDLHVHYLPGVDDGVKSEGEADALLDGLSALGFARFAATPHLRPGMFPNEPGALREAFGRFASARPERSLTLGGEHFVDDVLFDRMGRGDVLAYGRGLLVELPPRAFPMGLEQFVFAVTRSGRVPVLAHPERYAPFFEESTPLERLVDRGIRPQLDLGSLVGHYGRAPQRAALRMLRDGLYSYAASDAHGPRDVPVIERALARLRDEVDAAVVERLLVTGPRKLLDPPTEGG